MALTDVLCIRNTVQITTTLNHVDGRSFEYKIKPQHAMLDGRGYIRFFLLDWGDGDIQGYLLHPYYAVQPTSNPVLQGVSWTLGFLGGYGLSRARGELIRKLPQNINRAGHESIQLGAYFLTSVVGGYAIKSFADYLFSEKTLVFGYHNIITDKLIWKNCLQV